MLDEIFDTLRTLCLGCDYYVTIEFAQTICAPLLQNAQYATEVRKFSAQTRNRYVMKITKYPDVLALQYWPLFYTYFAIDFSERAIPANIDRSILLTARMGRYGVKVALLRCLIRLIIGIACVIYGLAWKLLFVFLILFRYFFLLLLCRSIIINMPTK